MARFNIELDDHFEREVDIKDVREKLRQVADVQRSWTPLILFLCGIAAVSVVGLLTYWSIGGFDHWIG